MRWTATILSLITILILAGLSVAYSGYSNPHTGFQVANSLQFRQDEQCKLLTVTIEDDAIYKTGYYVLGGNSTWTPFNFTQNSTDMWITSGKASAMLNISPSASTDNYILLYSCSRGTTWDCHGGQWQIWQFNTSIETEPILPYEDIEIIYKNTFEQDTLGIYRDDEIARDWDHGPYLIYKKGHLSIEQDTNDTDNPSKYVRVFHKQGSWGGMVPYEDSGTELYQYFPEGYEELYFSYRIKIQEGFENHATKGKIPSMEGYLKPIYAGHCVHGNDSFWAAMLFVPADAGIGISPFIYHVDMWKNTFNSYMNYEQYGSTCEEVYEKLKDNPDYGGVYGSGGTVLGLPMTTGQWHTVTERVVVNELGTNNGIVEIFLDGNLYSQRTDYTFRTVEELKINILAFVSFFGGGEESAAMADTSFYFDDFLAYRFKAGYGQPVGNTPSAADRTLPAIAIES